MAINIYDEFNIANQLLIMATIMPKTMLNFKSDTTSDNINTWEYGFLKSPIPSAIIEETGGFKHVNEAFAHLVGFSRSELENKSYASLTHPEDLQGHNTMIERLLSGEQSSFTFQKRYITKFEHIVKVYLYVQAIVDSGSPKLFFIHVLPIEVYTTLVSEGGITKQLSRNSRAFSKRFIIDQIEKHWIAILAAIVSLLIAIVNITVDYNKQKWELELLKNNRVIQQQLPPTPQNQIQLQPQAVPTYKK